MKTISLFRGMTSSAYDELVRTGLFRATRHSGNVASTDVTTALHWAGQRGDVDDPALVVTFDAPADAVEEDPWFEGDYRFVTDFSPIGLRVIRDNITEPINEVARADDLLCAFINNVITGRVS